MPQKYTKQDIALQDKRKTITEEINKLEEKAVELKEKKGKLNDADFKRLKEIKQELVGIAKEEQKISAEKNRQVTLESDRNDMLNEIQTKLKNQPEFMKKIANVSNGMLGTQRNMFEIHKLEKIEAKNLTSVKKKELKMRKAGNDIMSDILGNTQNIGTEEFQTYNISKLINYARSEGHKTLEDDLLLYKKMQQSQKRVNDVAMEGAKLVRAPIDKIREAIESVPGGKLLSKVLGLEQFADKMEDKFLSGFRKMKGIEKEGISPENANGVVDETAGMAEEKRMDWNEFQSDFAKSAPGEDSSARASAYRDYKAQFDVSEDINKSKSKAGKTQGGMNKKLKAGLGITLAIGGAIATWLTARFNFSKELGVSFGELKTMSLFAKEETKALLDEFGSLRDVSNQLLFSMKLRQMLGGPMATDTAKLLMLQQSMTTQSKEMAFKEQYKWIKEMKKEGLSAKKVFADMASHADFAANFWKEGGKNIEEAAAQAAKMGLSLDATESVANKLLDWETSIAAEMKASQLLGRQINLDKARELAFNQELVPMMEEVKRQAGGEAEFAKMSVVQRQALGDAIGLSGANLAEFMKTSDEANKKQQAGLLKSMFQYAGIAAIVLGILGGIMGALTLPIFGGIGFAGWAAMGAGIMKGAAWGALLGGIGGGIAHATGAQHGMNEMVAKPKLIMAGEAGPEHVAITPSKSGPPEQQQPTVVNVDISPLENQMKTMNALIGKLQTSAEADALGRAQIRAADSFGAPR